MKTFLIVGSLFLTSNVMAMTEVECSGRHSDKTVYVEVESGFGPGSFRNARVRVQSQGSTEMKNYRVSTSGTFGNRTRFTGPSFDLEVDFWPDTRPQWGRTYRGTFNSTELEIPFLMTWCRYPYARP